ncbi:serine hydrolase [Sphingomonas sp. I4]
MFQAGSISKPVTALAALRLVQRHRLSLDGDVNARLKGWKLPVPPGAPVTLRELLAHRAGTTVHGFPGYPAGALCRLSRISWLGARPPTRKRSSSIRRRARPGAVRAAVIPSCRN